MFSKYKKSYSIFTCAAFNYHSLLNRTTRFNYFKIYFINNFTFNIFVTQHIKAKQKRNKKYFTLKQINADRWWYTKKREKRNYTQIFLPTLIRTLKPIWYSCTHSFIFLSRKFLYYTINAYIFNRKFICNKILLFFWKTSIYERK